jgi:ABC-type transporter Mla MlaB component
MKQPPKPVSYLRAWLTSQSNMMTLLGGGLAAAVASIPAGGVGAIGALVVLGAVQALAALVIPDLPTFRSKVDRSARRASIDQRRAQLQQELFLLHGGLERVSGMAMWQKYQTVVERATVLYRIAGEEQSQLSYDDAERVDKASVDYLALWLAEVTIKDRLRNGEAATVDRRLREAEQALADVEASDPRYRHMKMARDDYLAIKLRHGGLVARQMSIEAALVSLPDQVEEIYQMVVASPYSSVLGSKLGESLSRLQLEEDIELELSQNDLDSHYFKTGAAAGSKQASAAKAQAQAAKQSASPP